MNISPRGNNKEPKSGSFLGFSLQEALAPLGISFQLFIHIIADTFAIYGLLPKNYPGLQDHNKRISLTHVMTTAWGNVKFSREGVPQAILFFSVIAVIFIGIFAIFSLLSSFMVGTAHAQTTAYDEVPTTDVAYQWIKYLFPEGDAVDAVGLPNFQTSGGVGSAFASASNDFGFRAALQQALGLYSHAMLVIATIILFYHLIVMTIQTAHSGVAMGSPQKQVWAPLRLVIAISLLVPINNKLNSGQYIFIKVAELGSRVATHVWTSFIDVAVDPEINTPIAAPMATDIATTMMLNYACVQDYNARIDAAGWSLYVASENNKEVFLGRLVSYEKENVVMNNQIGTLHTFRTENPVTGAVEMLLGQSHMCGYWFIPNPPKSEETVIGNAKAASDAAINMYEKQEDNFEKHLYKFQSVGDKISEFIHPSEGAGGTRETDAVPITLSGDYTSVAAEYQASVNNIVSDYSSKVSSKIIANTKSDIQSLGWAMAGAYLATISRAQSVLSGVVDGALPLVAGPNNPNVSYNTTGKPSNECTNSSDTLTPRQGTFCDLGKFTQAMNTAWSAGSGLTAGTINADEIQCAGVVSNPAAEAISAQVGNPAKLLNVVFSIVDHVAGWTNIWTSGTGNDCGNGTETFRLGVNFKNGVNAFDALIAFGHSTISTGLNLAAIGAIGLGMSSYLGGVAEAHGDKWSWVMEKLGQLAGFVGGFCFALAFIFLIMGFPFAFVLPLMPFIHFFFGIVAWLADVMESVVAVPVVALAQLNPEGEGFVGKASTAYHFVFAIALRPVLMVFGLIFGLLLFIIAANFFTYAFGAAIVAFGGTSVDFKVFAKMAFTAIYVYIIMQLANHCFQLIEHFPKFSLDWIGQKMPAQQSLGDPITHMKGAQELATAWVFKESTQKLGGIAKETGKLVGASMSKKIQQQRERQNDPLSRTPGDTTIETE